MAKQVTYNQSLSFQIFFGGFLAYLLLHHFAIPLTRNIGRGDWLLWDTHWDILIHSIFFITIGFYHARLKQINAFLAVVICFFILSKYFWVAWDIGHNKLNEKHFSQGISFLASLVFIAVFFLFYSRRFVLGKFHFKNVFLGGILGCILGQAFFFFEENYLTLEHYRYNYSKKIGQVEDLVLVEGYYPRDFSDVNKVILSDKGFLPSKIIYTPDHPIEITSEIKGNTPFKLEAWTSERWMATLSLVLKYREARRLEFDEKYSHYRLRNDSLPEHPLLLIFSKENQAGYFRISRRNLSIKTKD